MTSTAVLAPGEHDWSCAQIAEVPEAISQGPTLREAKTNVTQALELTLEWRRGEGKALPEPVGVTVIPVTVPGSGAAREAGQSRVRAAQWPAPALGQAARGRPSVDPCHNL